MPKGGGKVRKRQDSASSGAGDGGNNGESASNQSAKNSSSTNGDVRAGSPEKGCCHPVNCSCDDPLDLSKNAVKVICSNEGCPESSYMHDRCFDKWEDSVLDHLSCAPRIVTGRFLRWPKEKRRESLWTIRGYDLVKKAHVEVCKCRCGKGYLRKDTEWRPEEDTTAKKKKQKKGGSSQQQEQQKQQHKQQQQKEQQQQQQKEQQPPTQQQQQVKQAKPTLNHPVVKWPAPYMLPISERSTPPIPEHYIPGLNFEEQNGQKKKKKKKRSKSGKSETSSQNSESKPPTPDDLESQDVEEIVETVDKEEGVVEQLVELGFSRQASEEAVQIHGSMEEALDSLLKSSSSKTNGDNKIVDKELSTVVAPPPRKVDSNGNLTVPYPVQELMSLGFSREDSEAALRIHESLGSAVEYLMAQRQSARYRNNPLGNGFVASQPLAPTVFTPRPLDQFFPQNGPAFPQQQLFLQQNVEVPISQIPTPYSNPTSQLFPSLPPGFLQHQVPTPPQPPPSVPSIDDHVPLEAPAVKTNDKTDMSHAMQRLMDMGFSYRQSEAAFKQHGHLDSALDALISGEFDDFNWETQPKRNANKTDPFTNKVLIENSSSEADTTNQGGTFPSWHPMQSQNFISSLDTFSLPSKVPIGTPASDKQGMPEDPITAISVKVLTDMGFTSEQSYKAIKEHGTVEAALNSLITSAFNQSGSLDTEVYMSDEEDFPESLSPPKLNHSRSAFQPVAPRATQVGPRLTKSAMFPHAATAQAPVSLPKQQPTFSMRASAPVAARPAAPKVVAMNGHHGKAPGATPTPCAALWVGNVTAKVSQADLQTIFGKYGRILSIKIMHAKTCAFVNFTNMADATRARDGLQGTEIGGMELVIRFPDNPIINADGNFLMMKSKLKTGNQTGGQSAGKVSQSQSSYQQGKMKGPVETEFGEECFFYRTTGCHFGKNCSYLHISHHKGVDL
ncbi:uncharacterized protein LOC118430962 [Branchiostoma floridae]|uniref:Uncharacterized protein LOC118430962 n=1 Tax=Branchiostoma floridae TaxID=7739 RepID=A0A9J7MBA1_BRAFL|nr:uncharacterized protein LOC118430962 [Branchiostoma floridae]